MAVILKRIVIPGFSKAIIFQIGPGIIFRDVVISSSRIKTNHIWIGTANVDTEKNRMPLYERIHFTELHEGSELYAFNETAITTELYLVYTTFNKDGTPK